MIVTTTNSMKAPAATVLHVFGEVDTFASDDLRTHLRRLPLEPDGAVVIDLSAVTFMSCTALSILAEAQARLGSRLCLGRRSRVVTRLLDLTSLTSYFPAPEVDAGPGPDEPDGTAHGSRIPTSRPEAGTWTFSRTDVDRVRGLLMAVHGCDAQQAWSMLAQAAARHGVPVGELVELLASRQDSDSAPSSAAAVAALTVLMRQPVEGDADVGNPSVAAARPDRSAGRLTDI